MIFYCTNGPNFFFPAAEFFAWSGRIIFKRVGNTNYSVKIVDPDPELAGLVGSGVIFFDLDQASFPEPDPTFLT